MMASFLPVIVSKKNKQTKNVFYCSVSQLHINLEKNLKKHQNDFFGRTYIRHRIYCNVTPQSFSSVITFLSPILITESVNDRNLYHLHRCYRPPAFMSACIWRRHTDLSLYRPWPCISYQSRLKKNEVTRTPPYRRAR